MRSTAPVNAATRYSIQGSQASANAAACNGMTVEAVWTIACREQISGLPLLSSMADDRGVTLPLPLGTRPWLPPS